ncbi:hypothetical protein FACS189490_11760 [Clostridia bacterium]|nr:hypothetical protein FACS189490_11760 [Clostridia bacterium]
MSLLEVAMNFDKIENTIKAFIGEKFTEYEKVYGETAALRD